MSDRYDALVVGGGIEGLVAVATLAKAGLRALLLERSAILHGQSGSAALRALDPVAVKTLGLARHGLAFTVRDLGLTALPPGGTGIALVRDRHATARGLAALSPADARAYAPFRRALYALARDMRPAWWDGHPLAEVRARLGARPRDLLDLLSVASANAYLAATFESEPLRAALAFAVAELGAAPGEAGSALALAWAASQEMCGLQGAVALPRGGMAGLLRALSESAQALGAEIRTAANVTKITIAQGAATGIELANGEAIAAPIVLSALSRRRTLLDMLPAGEIGLGAARALARPPEGLGCATLLFALARLPGLPAGTRLVVAERPEIYDSALAAARLGRLPSEPALELLVAPVEEPPALTVRAWPVPAAFDRDALRAAVTAAVERLAPGFAATVGSCEVLEPPDGEPFSVPRLAAAASARSAMPVPGLLLCGIDAEPVHAASGRAARLAAASAIAQHRKVRVP